jgi:glycosyltransferase involved in cell wall biosynthesis
MDVSVALTTFNGERFLGEQLESIGRQTVLPKEVVLCDDGSTDGTLPLAAAYAKVAPFLVRIYRNPTRLGFADNFLQAAARCTGTHIAFCDQDDVWLETKLERCVRALSHPDVVLAVHSARVVDADLNWTGQCFPDIRRRVATRCPLGDPWTTPPGFAMVFSAKLLRAIDWKHRPQSHLAPLGTPKLHDQWIHFLAGALGQTVYLTDHLTLYRQHSSNACGLPSTVSTGNLVRALQADRTTYLGLADLACEYAAFLEDAARRADPSVQQRVLAAARFYCQMAAAAQQRGELYATGLSRRARAAQVMRLVRRRSYRARHLGGFGARSMLKDCAFAALGDRLLHASLREYLARINAIARRAVRSTPQRMADESGPR